MERKVRSAEVCWSASVPKQTIGDVEITALRHQSAVLQHQVADANMTLALSVMHRIPILRAWCKHGARRAALVRGGRRSSLKALCGPQPAGEPQQVVTAGNPRRVRGAAERPGGRVNPEGSAMRRLSHTISYMG